MKNKEIKKLSIDELKSKVNSLKKDLFNFRFRKVNGQLEDTAKIAQTGVFFKKNHDYIPAKGCTYSHLQPPQFHDRRTPSDLSRSFRSNR